MNIKNIALGFTTVLIFASCGTSSTVPVTGRKHTLLVNDEQVLSLSKQQYSEVLQKSTISTDATNTAMVQRVGKRLATAVETYLKQTGDTADLKYYEWEFNLVKSDEANAFCMPGGKIVVYEGILPITQDEASLAVVLGHEIAHAVAKHSAEQMSNKIRQQYGTQIVSGILSQTVSSNTAQLLSSVASTGFNFANLKYSRDNETEADHMGLIFAAMAGYDPQVATTFWERMAASSSSSNSKLSELLSDHPSDTKRIENIKTFMPEAQKYYKPVTTSTTNKKTTTQKTTKKKSTTKKTIKKSTKK